ncbi:hypothetical protein L596_016808 [Steinernema carpocapsae]|uniref:Uncharacterized protein n=1 Tax=Steinernema carpocapsae TaxID=34508 RepID=A0A4U5NJ64_STECR|nr:hypothetical protein L596_016808 [Steinernema carpocapsae]
MYRRAIWLFSLILALYAEEAHGAAMIWPVKVGEKVVLDLGPMIKTWTRHLSRNNTDATEIIALCEGDAKPGSAKCAGWRDLVTNEVTPSKDYVNKDGQLVIVSYQDLDAGQYGSPDEPMRITTFDGGYSMLPRSQINVMTKTNEKAN